MSFDLLDKVQISVLHPVALLSFLPFCSYKPEFKSVTQNIKRKVNWTMEYKKNKHLPLLKVCHSKAKRYILYFWLKMSYESNRTLAYKPCLFRAKKDCVFVAHV